MGGTPSRSTSTELPKPTQFYSPKSIQKHEEIESKFIDMLNNASKITFQQIMPTVGTLTAMTHHSIPFFDYVNSLTSIINLWSANNSIGPVMELMNVKIKEQSAKDAFANINSKIDTIKSRLKEVFDTKLTESNRHSKANIAADKCEEILCLFDNDSYILWDMGVISSSILIPFSTVCTQVIKINYETNCTSVNQSKKMKAQLVSVLKDYKKKCILDRLNCVKVETTDICLRGDNSGASVHTYGLDHSKFQDDTDKDLNREWYRCYECVDTWDDWKKQRTTYKSIIDYRQSLIDYYEKDFGNTIKRVCDQLVAINTTNEYTKKEKEFSKERVRWSVVSIY